MRGWLCAGLALVALSGCAGFGKRAPLGLAGRLPYDGRVLLLPAEAELAAAEARVAEAQAEVDRASDEVSAAKARLSSAKGDLQPVDGKEDLASLAVEEAKSRWLHAQAEQALAEERAKVEAFSVVCARARYELAKVEVAKKVQVDGADSLAAEPLLAQADGCAQKLEERRAQLSPKEGEVQRTLRAWEQRRALLARRNAHRPGPYLE